MGKARQIEPPQPPSGVVREEPYLVVEYSSNPEDPRLPVHRALVPLRAYLAYNCNMAEAFVVVTGLPGHWVVDYDDLDWYTSAGEPWHPAPPAPPTDQQVSK